MKTHTYTPKEENCQICGGKQEDHFEKCKKCGMVYTSGLVHNCEK